MQKNATLSPNNSLTPSFNPARLPQTDLGALRVYKGFLQTLSLSNIPESFPQLYPSDPLSPPDSLAYSVKSTSSFNHANTDID
jgi:hypothetical protein